MIIDAKLVNLQDEIDSITEPLRSTKEALRSIKEDLRYDIPPSRRANIKGSIVVIIRDQKKVGVAFFITPTVALTAAHNLTICAGSTLVKTVVCQRPNGARKICNFDVAAYDLSLDIAVLHLRKAETPSLHFIPIINLEEDQDDKGLFLATCHIHSERETSDTRLSVIFRRAHFIDEHKNHLHYDAPNFNGDSDGAVVIGRSGKVLGLHKELASAAREFIRHKEGVEEPLNLNDLSVKTLIAGSFCGCIGVRVDSNTVRNLILATEQG